MIITIELTKKDLLKQPKNKPTEKVSVYNFPLTKEQINSADFIYYKDEEGKTQILKTRRK